MQGVDSLRPFLFPAISSITIMNTELEAKTNEYLRGIVANLPEKPGVYQYLNTEGTIIYVGKAKNLKKRVYSYFSKEHEPGKTRVLVSKIADIRYIVVNTEEDALLLENNLIKKYKPRYNVLLKDDKTYPSICVQNEYFPRIFRTRKIIKNGSSYYGPYSHLPSMYAVLDLIKHLYPLRTCNLNLSPENIRAGKFKVCLEYHIKKCAGPCVGLQSHEDYLKNIDEIGEKIAQSIITYFSNPVNRELVERLKSNGLQLHRTEEDLSGYTDKLAGQSIVISGVFTHHSRDEYKEMIEKNGGKNVGSISSKTSFILAGENMGPAKLEKAQKLGVKIMSEDEFLALIS